MKTYRKPELYYESFELSQHIAGGCQLMVTAQMNEGANSCNASGTLPYVDGFIQNGFVKGDADCLTAVEIYCYQNSLSLVGLAYNS